MSIMIKSKNKYYEIPEEILKKCVVSKKLFETGLKNKKADVVGQCTLVDLSTCCDPHASYNASCL